MVLNFYGGVTASSGAYHWTTVLGNGVDEVRIMIRKSIDDPGRPSGVVLSASICFWIPVLPKVVFEYLRNHSTRAEVLLSLLQPPPHPTKEKMLK
jgi:homeobox-leucine zipper protein